MYKIKQKPNDFIVEEIMPSGEILNHNKEYSFDKNTEGNQLVCVLKKKNWDTISATREVAKRLYVSKSRVGYAGMKDKRAVTSQRISIFNIKKEQTENLKIKDIEIFPIKYSDKRINLGDLKGNHFKIIVHSDKKPHKVKKIPNYYGEQRFGKMRGNSAEMGKLIIEEKFKDAVLYYLTDTSNEENKEAREAREKLKEEMDFKKANEYFPNYLGFEKIMISKLAEEKDYLKALKAMPKKLLLMFVHAYQSKLFNQYLDEIIKRNLNYEEGPLFGYKYEVTNELEKEILDKNEIYVDHFLIRDFLKMSVKGSKRKLFVELEDLKIEEREKNKYLVEFSLPKASYATVVIDYLFKKLSP